MYLRTLAPSCLVALSVLIAPTPAGAQAWNQGGSPQEAVAALMAAGQSEERAGDYRGALTAYNRAATLAPRDGRIRLKVGEMYARIHDLTDAVQQWKYALELDPSLTQARADIDRAEGRPVPPPPPPPASLATTPETLTTPAATVAADHVRAGKVLLTFAGPSIASQVGADSSIGVQYDGFNFETARWQNPPPPPPGQPPPPPGLPPPPGWSPNGKIKGCIAPLPENGVLRVPVFQQLETCPGGEYPIIAGQSLLVLDQADHFVLVHIDRSDATIAFTWRMATSIDVLGPDGKTTPSPFSGGPVGAAAPRVRTSGMGQILYATPSPVSMTIDTVDADTHSVVDSTTYQATNYVAYDPARRTAVGLTGDGTYDPSGRARVSGSLGDFVVVTNGRDEHHYAVPHGPITGTGGASFSPDGRFLAFHQNDGIAAPTGGPLYVLDTRSSLLKRVSDCGAGIAAEAWLPQGGLIFSSDKAFYETTPDLDHCTKLAPNAGSIDEGGGFSLSPDGRRIAWTAKDDNGVNQVWVRSLDGAQIRHVTHGGNGSFGPVFSPDGKKIAYLTGCCGLFDLHLVGVDGSGDRKLPVHAINHLIQWYPGRLPSMWLSGKPHGGRHSRHPTRRRL